MTPQQIKAWRTTLKLSQRAAAEQLGVALPTYQAMERGFAFGTSKPVIIDRRTALACAALAAGLGPWCGVPTTPAD